MSLAERIACRFRFAERGTNFRTETIAGFTTFMTMAYILVVNPQILGRAFGEEYLGALVFATAVSAAFASMVMGVLADYPFALAPGMGLNGFFAFTVVLGLGFPFDLALGIVFVEGLVFIVLTLTKARTAILEAIPGSLKSATAVGIGLFIALIGLGVDMKLIIAQGPLAAIAGPEDFLRPGMDSMGNFQIMETFLSPFSTKWAIMSVVGLVVLIVLLSLRVKGALLWGILGTSIIGWAISASPRPEGVFELPSFEHSLVGKAFEGLGSITGENILDVVVVGFAFLFVDVFDTMGTLMGLSHRAGYIGKDGRLPRAERALLADALGTTVGAALGTSTVTSYIESASGIAEGGRTGFTAIVAGAIFLLTVFFVPVFKAVPGYATGPALVIVGVLMMKSVTEIDWDDLADAVPSFLIIAGIPFFFSIADGLAVGFIAYPLILALRGGIRRVSVVVWIISAVFILRYVLIATGVLPWPVTPL